LLCHVTQFELQPNDRQPVLARKASAWQKSNDTGKKISGIKQSIVVDMQGLPHAVAVATAE
jgi:hypothetical protein